MIRFSLIIIAISCFLNSCTKDSEFTDKPTILSAEINKTLKNNDTLRLDIDSNGTSDLTFVFTYDFSADKSQYSFSSLYVGDIETDINTKYGDLFQLDQAVPHKINSQIDSSVLWMIGLNVNYARNFKYATLGAYNRPLGKPEEILGIYNIGKTYIGFRFRTDTKKNSWKYGWVYLEHTNTSLSIYRYSFNSIADQPIIVGEI